MAKASTTNRPSHTGGPQTKLHSHYLRRALIALAALFAFPPLSAAADEQWKPTQEEMDAMGGPLDALAVLRKDAGEFNLCAFIGDGRRNGALVSASVTARAVTIKCAGQPEPLVIEIASRAAMGVNTISHNDRLMFCQVKGGGALYARTRQPEEMECLRSNTFYKREALRRFVTAWTIVSQSWTIDLPDEATLREQAKTLPPPTADQQETLRRTQIQVEVAIKENRLIDAAKLYRSALTDAPSWAGGHFNRALLMADLEFYPAAIWHMRLYLALSPDAPDARAARDKMYEWEARLPRPAQ